MKFENHNNWNSLIFKKWRDNTEEKNEAISYSGAAFLCDFFFMLTVPLPVSLCLLTVLLCFGTSTRGCGGIERQVKLFTSFCFSLLVMIKYFLDEKFAFNVKLLMLFFKCISLRLIWLIQGQKYYIVHLFLRRLRINECWIFMTEHILVKFVFCCSLFILTKQLKRHRFYFSPVNT